MCDFIWPGVVSNHDTKRTQIQQLKQQEKDHKKTLIIKLDQELKAKDDSNNDLAQQIKLIQKQIKKQKQLEETARK